MLVVTSLGGSALCRREVPLTAEDHRRAVRLAAEALAPVAAAHQLVIGRGHGPAPGLPAHEADALVGSMIEQELASLLPFDRPFATLLTMVEVDRFDRAFQRPTTFVGPAVDKDEADRLAAQHHWAFRQDGEEWRRVVASPEPKRTLELRPIRWLLERNTIVIAAGGGLSAMSAAGPAGALCGAECVIDPDLASALLARELDADVFVMLTDARAVDADWGGAARRPIRRASPAALADIPFAASSMRPKIDAACRFAVATGKPAAIGALCDFEQIVAGRAGTTISTAEDGVVYAEGRAAGTTLVTGH